MANTLVLFGFCWMVVAALLGLVLAKRHETALGQLEQLAAKNNLAEYHRVDDIYKWNKMVHAHAFLFSVVAVCIGLAMARMNLSAMVGNALSIALMGSAAVWTLGALLKSRLLMVIGDLTLLVSLITAAVGMAKVL